MSDNFESWRLQQSPIPIDWVKALATATTLKETGDDRGNLARAFLAMRGQMRQKAKQRGDLVD